MTSYRPPPQGRSALGGLRNAIIAWFVIMALFLGGFLLTRQLSASGTREMTWPIFAATLPLLVALVLSHHEAAQIVAEIERAYPPVRRFTGLAAWRTILVCLTVLYPLSGVLVFSLISPDYATYWPSMALMMLAPISLMGVFGCNVILGMRPKA